MIIERKFNSKLKRFSEIGVGECFETQIGVDDTGNGTPYVDFDCSGVYIKIPTLMDNIEDCTGIRRMLVYNAINLKDGMPKTMLDDDWVIKSETKVIVN